MSKKCVYYAAICVDYANRIEMVIFNVILALRKGVNMEKLSNFITDFCMRHSEIPQEKREIYNYGFKLIFADIINFTIVILLGLCIRRALESVIFLLTLSGLRMYSGGYHAKTFLLCRLSMIATYIAVMLTTWLVLSINRATTIVVIINIISVLGVTKLAPIENINKKLSSRQIRENKIKSVIIASALSFISTVLFLLNIREEGVIISITLLAVVILMIVGLVAKKGGGSNVQLVE